MSKLSIIVRLLQTYVFLVTWISLVAFIFYKKFEYYNEGPQFRDLRNMLGISLCLSRATASVVNICSALILLPLCKKLNQSLYRIMSKTCPGLFFFWLEKAKSFHMTVATTLVFFSVIHSISHFVNMWNFSRNYNDQWKEINFSSYRNENPLRMICTQPGLTGVSMLLIILSMGVTSLRSVRRKFYNAFWYTHRLHLPFLLLLLVHPLSGVLKERVSESQQTFTSETNLTENNGNAKFVSIKSTTWYWMVFPLSCFFVDTFWRLCSRNLNRVKILEVHHMPGRMIRFTLECPSERFVCKPGQYILLQCCEISTIEWHPFTVVEVPKFTERRFSVWIRIKGDWTEALEELLKKRDADDVKGLTLLADGPFPSPMQGVIKSGIAVCVAAGVGITPFVSVISEMLRNPRQKYPGRVHILWIVRYEHEVIWLADLASKTLLSLRENNRPDRLHLEIYVTNNKYKTDLNDADVIMNQRTVVENSKDNIIGCNVVVINEKTIHSIIRKIDMKNEDKVNLLSPILAMKRFGAIRKQESRTKEKNRSEDKSLFVDEKYELAKEFPLLACRLRKGRPHWDKIFGYWIHLYPKEKLNLYCCGPKKLIRELRKKCEATTRSTNTAITFFHEGFS